MRYVHLLVSRLLALLQTGTTEGGTESGFHVQYLPPILLQLSLPAAYPSQQPPDVNLSASWLTQQHMQQLQQRLSQIWANSAGFPVCYTWIDWLQQDALAHLGVSDALTLSQCACASTTSSCAQKQKACGSLETSPSQCQSPESESCCAYSPSQQPPANVEELLMKLLQYNAVEKQHAFQAGTWSCGICFEQFPGSCCIQASLKCGHVYCRSCMAQHCGLHVKEGSLEFLRCPEPDCKEPLDRPVRSSLPSSHLTLQTAAGHVSRAIGMQLVCVCVCDVVSHLALLLLQGVQHNQSSMRGCPRSIK